MLSKFKINSKATKSIHKAFYNFIRLYDEIDNEPDMSIRKEIKLEIIDTFYRYLIENYYIIFAFSSSHFTNRYRNIIFDFSKEYCNKINEWKKEDTLFETKKTKVLDTLATYQKLYKNHYTPVRKTLEVILDDDVISYILCFI